MDSQEIPLDVHSLDRGSPHTLSPGQHQGDHLFTVNQVKVRGSRASPTDTQDPLRDMLDLNTESHDPQGKGDRELLKDSPETPLDVHSLARGSPHPLSPGQHQGDHLFTVSQVKVRGSRASPTDTQDPLRDMLDLNTESRDLQVKRDRELLKDSPEIPLDAHSLARGSPHTLSPGQHQGDHLFTVNQVKVRGSRASPTDTQDPLRDMLDLNTESRDPQVKGDRELLKDSPETPVDVHSLARGSPHTLSPGQHQGDHLFTVSQVKVRGSRASPTDTQDPLRDMLDLNTESRDLQVKRDRELLKDSPEIPLDAHSLARGSPHTLSPGQHQGDHLFTVNQVKVRGSRASPTDTQDPLRDMLDLNTESRDPQVKGDRELLKDSPETPLDAHSLARGSPHTLSPGQLQGDRLFTLSQVKVRGIQASPTDTQDPLRDMLDLNTESRDPQVKGDRELLKDSPETPVDVHSLARGSPHTLSPGQHQGDRLFTLSQVKVRGSRASPTDTRDPLRDMLDLNTESRDPQVKRDRELLKDSPETQLDAHSLARGSPHTLSPGQLQGDRLFTLSQVKVRGILASPTDTQDPLRDMLDLNTESHDPQGKGDRELLKDSPETPLDAHSLARGSPHPLSPGQHQGDHLFTVSQVKVRGSRASPTDTQDPLRDMLDLNTESRDPQVKGDRELLKDSPGTPLDVHSLARGSPHTLSPGQLQGDRLFTLSQVKVRGSRASPTDTQDPLRDMLDLNTESQDPQVKGDRELLKDSPETPLDAHSLARGSPHTLSPGQHQGDRLFTLSQVKVRGSRASPTDTQDPLRDMLDLNTESHDPQGKGDRELLKDSPETPLDAHSLARGSPHPLSPGQHQGDHLFTVSQVKVRGSRASPTDTQDPLRDMVDLNTESRDPQVKRDRELLKDSPEIPLDVHSLARGSPHTLSPGQHQGDHLFTVNQVKVRGSRASPTDTQDPLRDMLDLNTESRDPQVKGDRELLKDSPETPVDVHSLARGSPHTLSPGQHQGDRLFTLSQVKVRGSRASPTDTQDPLRDMLDLNTESHDPQGKGDRELLKDSPETPLDAHSLVRGSPHTLSPGQHQGDHLFTVSQVKVRGSRASPTDTQDPLRDMLDLNTESRDLQVKRDRELLKDSPEIPLDVHSLARGSPHTLSPGQHQGDHLFTVNQVKVRGSRASPTDTQDPLRDMLDLNTESRDPQVKGDRELLKDSPETPLDVHSLARGSPHTLSPGQLQGDRLFTLSQVKVRGSRASPTDTRDPLRDMLDLNTESQDPQGKGDRELLKDSPETPLDAHSLARGSPHILSPGQLQGDRLFTLNQVKVRGSQASPTDTQDPLRDMLDLNTESRDPQGKRHRELLKDSPEIPLDVHSLGRGSPHTLSPGQHQGDHLFTVSQVKVRGSRASPTDTQDPLRDMLDLNTESRDLQVKRDRELLKDSPEIPLDVHSLARGSPHTLSPGQHQGDRLFTVSQVKVRGSRASPTDTRDPLRDMLDLNTESRDPQVKGDRELLKDSPETPLDVHSLARGSPHTLSPGQLQGDRLFTLSQVKVRGSRASPTDTQDPLRDMLDLNTESQDPQGKGDRELLKDSPETPLDAHSLARGSPHTLSPGQLQGDHLFTVSQVKVEGGRASPTDTQDPLRVMLDLTIKNWDLVIHSHIILTSCQEII
ncbi:uncharacterized protein LOC124989635 [Sciurus carolinensis]|uniref:uncharacterized protein LOC124989635 n=1 Tax=Sciurus carolinensis TaxID=30640 RepID=UPI001FB52DDE|nr:uncharacterized protein LOC124989635 [Sciurus carolinensis]